jgi:hypothetical protein
MHHILPRKAHLFGGGGGGSYATLSAYLLTLSPSWLLNHEEASGATATDDSGNSVDFTYNATTAYQADPTSFGTQLEKGVTFSAGGYASNANGLPDYGTNATHLTYASVSMGGSTVGLMSARVANRFLFVHLSNIMRCYTSAYATFSVTTNVDGEHLWCATADGTTFKLYMDGFLVATATGTAISSLTGDVDGSVGAYTDGTNAGNGSHFISASWAGTTLTAANLRSIWEQMAGYSYWYHSKIDDELGLTGSVGYCYEFIGQETTTGVQVIDCSGNEVHGITSGTTEHAIASTGNTRYFNVATDYIRTAASYIDLRTDFTIAFEFQLDDGTTTQRAIYGNNVYDTECVKLEIDASDDLILTFKATATDTITATGSYRDASWHSIVIRVDNTATNLDMWVDGTKQSTTTITATPGATKQQPMLMRHITGTGAIGYMRRHAHFDLALSDAQCAAMYT